MKRIKVRKIQGKSYLISEKFLLMILVENLMCREATPNDERR